MRKSILVAILAICSLSAYGVPTGTKPEAVPHGESVEQNVALNEGSARSRASFSLSELKGLSFGVGLPIECRDLPGMGLTANIGYDCAYPINDHFALGFYLTGGGGFWGEFKKYSDYDHFHVSFRLTAGLMMQIGDPQNKPWLVGVAPCTGFGLYDLDMTLPVEVRFGKFITDRWYIMGELTYHASLAHETATIEPAIRVGYNFGRKVKVRK